MKQSTIAKQFPAMATQDGAGVSLNRALGQRNEWRMDPFLMMDYFSSDKADDYIAGFPNHPHRGFETITYMIDGHMLHEDHLGNKGDLKAGDVQWMTAGRGIIHSEMPQQEDGLMRGFQIWLNLPAKDKMQAAKYKDIAYTEHPKITLDQEGQLILLAGNLNYEDKNYSATIQSEATQPLIADIQLVANQSITLPIDNTLNALVFAFEGQIAINQEVAQNQHTVILSAGDQVTITAVNGPARCMLLAGKALNEPVAQYGPFVMNTAEELQQAVQDFQSGEFIKA